MKISREQASEILHMAGFCTSEDRLNCSDATMDLLGAIAVAYPDTLESFRYLYLSIASLKWYLTLPAETRVLSPTERPARPVGWWKPGVTIEGLPCDESLW